MKIGSKHPIKIERQTLHALFITLETWLHLGGRLKIQWLRLNGNDLHPMRFIRDVDRGLNNDQTVIPKSPYKLRCSATMLSIREQLE